MNQRQRRRKKKLVNAANLSPGIAEGLTQDASLEEALQEAERKRPITNVSGLDVVKHMREADVRLERSRDGFAGFVASNDTQAVWTDGATKRKQLDVHKTYTKAGMRVLREGRQCLRCDEPLEPAFPVQCPLCGYAVADRQIMDIAMEFEGTKHLGPSKPITEYMAQQEERVEKRRFIRRVLDGGQGRIPAAWLHDATLLEDLTPEERQMIGTS